MSKALPKHEDILGREINVGDYVAASRDNHLRVFRVHKLNAKMLGLTMVNSGYTINRYSHDCALLDRDAAIFHALRGSE